MKPSLRRAAESFVAHLNAPEDQTVDLMDAFTAGMACAVAMLEETFTVSEEAADELVEEMEVMIKEVADRRGVPLDVN